MAHGDAALIAGIQGFLCDISGSGKTLVAGIVGKIRMQIDRRIMLGRHLEHDVDMALGIFPGQFIVGTATHHVGAELHGFFHQVGSTR
ncbi:hypothetical protein D3C81_1702230 [compost metagenome]